MILMLGNDKTISDEVRGGMTEKETCTKHGEVFLYFECAGDFKNIMEPDMVSMCEKGIKDFRAKLVVDTRTFANIKDRLKGIEYPQGKLKVHRRERWRLLRIA